MNAPAPDELIQAVVELRALFPDWRLGQLVANLALAAGRDGAVWDVEDDELLTAARRLIDQNSARRAAPAEPAATPDRGSTLSVRG